MSEYVGSVMHLSAIDLPNNGLLFMGKSALILKSGFSLLHSRTQTMITPAVYMNDPNAISTIIPESII